MEDNSLNWPVELFTLEQLEEAEEIKTHLTNSSSSMSEKKLKDEDSLSNVIKNHAAALDP